MTTACNTYRLDVEADAFTQRVVALTDDGQVIVGAYRPNGLNDWRVYLTKLVVDGLGLPQPHKVHCCSREDAIRWLDFIATLYTKAVNA